MTLPTITDFVSAQLEEHPAVKLPILRGAIALCRAIEGGAHSAGWAAFFLELELLRLQGGR